MSEGDPVPTIASSAVARGFNSSRRSRALPLFACPYATRHEQAEPKKTPLKALVMLPSVSSVAESPSPGILSDGLPPCRCITVRYGLFPVVGQPSERLKSGTVVASGPPLSMTNTPIAVLPSIS